jgi:transcriptional regulator with XRE-family HTH domain
MDLPFREMREQRGLSQQDLADLSGIPLEILRDIEAGVQEVSLEDIDRTFQTLQSLTEWEGLSIKQPA